MTMPVHNVLSRRAALQKGFQPGLYAYDPGIVPTGEVMAVLDFKIWAKKIMGIGCYFTQTDTGRKFLLTVYCDYATARYRVKGSLVDFATCPVGCIYQLKVGRHPAGRMVIERVALP